METGLIAFYAYLYVFIRRRQLDKPESLDIFIPVNLHKYGKHCLFISILADVYWWFLKIGF